MTGIDASAIAEKLARLYPKSVLATIAATPTSGKPLTEYRDDPIGFAADVLGVSLTDAQRDVLQSLPGRVKVNSGHGVGKSFVSALACAWWFYTRNPGVVITTAPTKHHVETVLWAEIRLLILRAKVRLPDFLLPKAPKLYDNPDHWAEGITAATGEGFQGRHRPFMLFLIDECEDVDAVFWQAIDTMYQPDSGHGIIAIGNPYTTSSQSFIEDNKRSPDGSPKWKLITLSALNHPNVIAELAGQQRPYPHAVTLAQVSQLVEDRTSYVPTGDNRPGDIEWPPNSSVYRRPGPLFLAGVMGIRPSGGIDSVWSAAAWDLCCQRRWRESDVWVRNCGITIGVDAAGYGDDDSVMHVRSGPISLHHEGHNGWGPDKTAGRLKEFCHEFSAIYNSWASTDRPSLSPAGVHVTIELDGGWGLGVLSHRADYHRWRGITVGGSSAISGINGDPVYANVRSELWCESAKKAEGGMIDVSRLSSDVRDKLRLQLLTPYYEIRPNGTRMVEAKRDIKKRLGRSPDDADSLILSHYVVPDMSPMVIGRDDEYN